MYTTGQVVYGVPLTAKVRRVIEEAGKEPEKDFGFTMLYSGVADEEPGYLGEELVEFDECESFPLSKLTVQPTAEQRAAVQAKIDKLPPEVKTVLKKIDLWVVWSTS